jgi:hypothetical protein
MCQERFSICWSSIQVISFFSDLPFDIDLNIFFIGISAFVATRLESTGNKMRVNATVNVMATRPKTAAVAGLTEFSI